MIFVQTPSGTRVMSIDELLKDDLNLNEVQANDFIDPMSVRIPTGRDITEQFDLPSDEEIASLEAEYRKKTGYDKF